MRFVYKIFLTLFIFIGIGLTSAIQAQTAGNGGLNAFDFAQISPYARAIGMGGAYTALGDDVGSIYYNPAGIANVLTTEVNMTYLALYQGLSYETLAFAYPMEPAFHGMAGTFAVSVNMLQAGTLYRTNDAGVTVNGNSTFTAGDNLFTFSYASHLGPDFQAGLSLKYIQQQIDVVSTSLIALDAGAVFAPGNNGIRVGVDLKNMGDTSSGYSLPFVLNTGISYRTYGLFTRQDDAALSVDAALPLEIQDSLAVNLGAEYNLKWVGSRFSLRAGYSFIGMTDLSGIGLSFGAGYGLDVGGVVLFLDYAFVPEDVFGASNRFSLTTKF
jgi:hypothetical protein